MGGGGEEEEEEDEGHDEADHHKKQRRLPVHLKLLQLTFSFLSWTACPLLLPMNLIYGDLCLITAAPNSYSFLMKPFQKCVKEMQESACHKQCKTLSLSGF